MHTQNTTTLLRIAEEMLIAAQTAPKARGIDNLIYGILTDHQKELVTLKMNEIGNKTNASFFLRDANNITQSNVVVMLGTKIKTIGLQDICGLCGFKNCIEKEQHTHIPCIYNTNDLGIAIGSAVSMAMDKRIDNRVMFSAGQAARDLRLFCSEPHILFAIPLSASAKNIFFDRK